MTNFPTRLSLVARIWRLQVWKAVYYLRVDGFTPTALPLRIFPKASSFGQLRELVVKTSIDLSGVLRDSPRLERAKLVFGNDSILALELANHPSLTSLSIQFIEYRAQVSIFSVMPRNLKRFKAKFTHGGADLAQMARASPNLVYFHYHGIALQDSEAIHLKELSHLQTLRLTLGTFTGLEAILLRFRRERLESVAVRRWIEKNLPPIEPGKLELGKSHFFDPPQFFQQPSPQVGLRLGFIPTAKSLKKHLRNTSADRVNGTVLGQWVVDHFDVGQLLPSTDLFACALTAPNEDLAKYVLSTLFVPYIKLCAPRVQATSPNATQAQVEGYIASRALLAGKFNYEPFGLSRSTVTSLIQAYNIPLDLNYRHNGTPLSHLLGAKALEALVDRARTLNTPVDFRATDAEGRSITAKAHEEENYARSIRWDVLLIVARHDVTYLAQNPYEFIGSAPTQFGWSNFGHPSGDASAAREQLLELLGQTNSAISGIELLRYFGPDSPNFELAIDAID